ncbi:MAG TPA: helix-turn-helix domain-containing protein [Desulfovibrio sp.]|uniref:helix-turn-helix domain-containing protein n=1 Tax=Desulfovibrio sp. TaxID=885 RepID=UPI002B52CDF5|nr:helix-turn-helix domain-containing protein [Desulfovibrio sp.]HMM40117.1 helix-turn-helix domain-containing protein [Desulfovibrio sp.]
MKPIYPTQKLTTEEAAAYLRLQPGTLEVWRCRGRGPAYQKLGRRVVYDRADLDAFANSHTVLTIDTYHLAEGRHD